MGEDKFQDGALQGGQKLQAGKNLYRAYVNNTFELVFHTTLEGKILFANNLFLEHFGLSGIADIAFATADEFFVQKKQYEDILDQAINDQKLKAQRIDFRKRNGGTIKALVNVLKVEACGKCMFIWTILDITEQTEIENQLKKQNEELAKVNSQMEKFLYSASHDLRSPITTILGLTHLMQIESKNNISMDYIDKIEASAIKLDKIIRNIISFSKTNYQRITSDRIQFEPLIWKVWNNYRDNPALRNIHMEVQVEDGVTFYTDGERLEIIIDHLLQNAIQFFDPNKSRSFIRVHVLLDHECASIEFADNGIGIGSQHIENVFAMFYKASYVSKGAGLGLYIVKEAVAQLNGIIKVESEIGFGTVFRIIIPQDHKGKLINRKLQLQNNVEVSKYTDRSR